VYHALERKGCDPQDIKAEQVLRSAWPGKSQAWLANMVRAESHKYWHCQIKIVPWPESWPRYKNIVYVLCSKPCCVNDSLLNMAFTFPKTYAFTFFNVYKANQYSYKLIGLVTVYNEKKADLAAVPYREKYTDGQSKLFKGEFRGKSTT
jgi:hypothetical protein